MIDKSVEGNMSIKRRTFPSRRGGYRSYRKIRLFLGETRKDQGAREQTAL